MSASQHAHPQGHVGRRIRACSLIGTLNADAHEAGALLIRYVGIAEYLTLPTDYVWVIAKTIIRPAMTSTAALISLVASFSIGLNTQTARLVASVPRCYEKSLALQRSRYLGMPDPITMTAWHYVRPPPHQIHTMLLEIAPLYHLKPRRLVEQLMYIILDVRLFNF